MIGRSDVWYYNAEHRERSWWIGKPWRRVELLVQDYWYRGERVSREWDVQVTLAVPRFGWHANWNLVRSFNDYSDEEHQ